MTFQLVYYSQQDPKWKEDLLGFGDPGDTIGYVGCALTSVAMLLSGHGYVETPKSLNTKLKGVSGFVSAAIRWGAVSQLYPQVTVKSSISCINADAPLSLIDSSIAAGQPVIVMVDNSPASGLQTHWVLLYAREGSDYLMLDPWPYQTDVTKKTLLMPRYSQGKTLQRAINHVIIYENLNASGGIAKPDGTISAPQPGPAPAPSTPGYGLARVKATVTWGLNIRSSIDTTSSSNIIAAVSAGTPLALMEPDGPLKVGAINQWVRVRAADGKEGFCAAWYLEAIPSTPVSPPPAQPSTPSQPSTPIAPPPPTPSPPVQPATPAFELIVSVSPKVGRFGANIYEEANLKSKQISNEKIGSKLYVLEPRANALKKIGMAGKWLNVQTQAGKRGYVEAQKVKES